MALKNSDLFAVYRESDTTAYHLKASNLQFKLPDGDDTNNTLVWNGATWVPGPSTGGSDLADGTAENNLLLWDGTAWSPGNTIDGGTYA
jgi:hypothetical protein